jgi:hypothetical protein
MNNPIVDDASNKGKPGEWPVPNPTCLLDDPDAYGTSYCALQRDRARIELVTDSITADAAEQTTLHALRVCRARYCERLNRIFDQAEAELGGAA